MARVKKIRRYRTKALRFNPIDFLSQAGVGKKVLVLKEKSILFSQGDTCDSIFYIQEGRISLTVVSKNGKEATVTFLRKGDFVGEEAIATVQPQRITTATAVTPCTVLRIEKAEMIRILHTESTFSDVFVAFLLASNVRNQENLIDQLFNSSEKRLARTLLLLARFGKEGSPETVIPKISQEKLAEMIGASRARVSAFMNRFRELGYIEYNGELRIHSSLLNIILHD